MANPGCIRRDAEELLRLSQLTDIENVKRILNVEAEKLKQLADDEDKAKQSTASAQKIAKPQIPTIKISNYAWDQSEKFLKIYVTFEKAHTFPEKNLTANFTRNSFDFLVENMDNKIHKLEIKGLLYDIDPKESYFKVKTDMVILFLRKDAPKDWDVVTKSEKKTKETKTPKFDKDEDPGQNLMSLMRQMYEDGDDEMKRTIAKAWTEARDKKPSDELS